MYTDVPDRKRIVALDVEGSGANVVEHDLVAIGGALMELCYATGEISVLKTLFVAGVVDRARFEPRCWHEFWNRDPRHLERLAEFERCAVSQREMFDKLDQFLLACELRCARDGLADALEYVSDFKDYDIAHLNHGLALHLGAQPLHYRRRGARPAPGASGRLECPPEAHRFQPCLDTGSLVRGIMLGTGNAAQRMHTAMSPWPRTGALLARAQPGAPECPFPHDHHPTNDALHIGWRYLRLVSAFVRSEGTFGAAQAQAVPWVPWCPPVARAQRGAVRGDALT